MANRTKLTPKKEEQFLNRLRQGTSVSDAAKTIGVARQTCYEHRQANEAFRAAWDEAIEEGTEALEDEARRRAVEGWDEPVFYKGELQGQVRRYSDTLLIFLLKGRVPEKYRDRVDMTTKGEKLPSPQVYLPAIAEDGDE